MICVRYSTCDLHPSVASIVDHILRYAGADRRRARRGNTIGCVVVVREVEDRSSTGLDRVDLCNVLERKLQVLSTELASCQ
jgi:hypothetical protein